MSTIVPARASTRGLTIRYATLSARLAAVVAVEQVIILLAAVGAIGTGKHTTTRVRRPLGHTSWLISLSDRDAHMVSTHIDLPADIDGGIVARRELAPHVVDTTKISKTGDVVVQASKSARNAVGGAHSDRPARSNGNGDQCLAHVHAYCLVIAGWQVPKDNSEGNASVVVILKGVRSVCSDPNKTIVAMVVSSL